MRAGETDEAVQMLGDALALAEPGGFIRIFVDEGLPMAQLLSEAAARGIRPDYVASCWRHLKLRASRSPRRNPSAHLSALHSLFSIH